MGRASAAGGQRWRATHRAIALTLGVVLGAAGCSAGKDAAPAPGTASAAPPATVVAPPRQPDLDGTSGLAGPNLCTLLDVRSVGRALGATLTSRRYSWNDGGVPSLDLCALTLAGPGSGVRTVVVGLSALPAQPASLGRLAGTLGSAPESAPQIGPHAVVGRFGAAFVAADRVVRVRAEPELSRPDAVELAHALTPLVPRAARPARITDGACQPSGSTAKQFLGAEPQLRRDYRIRNGGRTCLWGTTDRTVAIVESISGRRDPIPEATADPPPTLAPIGDEAYYLARDGQLVFRNGLHIVRVSALADPAIPVSFDQLVAIVDPIMPLFLP